MGRVAETLAGWARRTTTSFSDLLGSAGAGTAFADTEVLPGGEELIFRLRHWPMLPAELRRAPVLRLLSIMSSRPVNRSWLLRHSQLQPREVDRLLAHLGRERALEITDPAGFRRESA